MSGLFGYFSSTPNHDKMVSIAKTIGYTIQEVKASENSLVCKVDVNTMDNENIIIDKQSGDYLVLCGEIYNEDIPNPISFLLEVCQQGNFEKLKQINGSYLVAVYDHLKDKLILLNDRFGSKKLFYSFEDQNFHFSPKISPLMKLVRQKKIRKDALLDFFIFGYYLGDKTFDEHVHQLPPGSILEISKNTLSVKNYWAYPYKERYDTRDFETLRDELGRIWQNAVDRRIKNNEKIIIEISGGLDSRAILAAALKSTSKQNILLYTFGDERGYDCEIGKIIASTLGIKHVFIPAFKDNFVNQYKKSFHDVEGMIDITPYSPIHMDQALQKYGQKIFNGYMGGEIMGPLIFPKIENLNLQSDKEYQKVKEILFNHHKMNDINTIKLLFNHVFLKETNLLSSFDKSVKELKNISREMLPNYCAAWLYMNESDKYTSFCNFRFQNVFEYSKPFLDTELIEFMLRIPPAFRKDKMLYKQVLVKNYTELFRLPTKNYLGLPIQTNRLKLYVKRILWFLELKINTISNHIVQHRVFFNKNQNYLDYDDLLRTNKQYQVFIKSMIDKVKKREFFNPDYIETLWQTHLDGKKNYAMIFGLLATVEFILEEFYDS